MKTKLSKVSLILSFCVYLIGLVVLGEFILSVIRPAPLFENIDIFSHDAHFMLSPNRTLIYVPKPNTGDFNSYGHRGKNFSFQKSGKQRIVFMGDSVTYGLGVKVEKRYTELLNAKLGQRYEIINLAVSGYNLLQELEYFKVLGIKFSPDYVVFAINYNDMFLDSGELWDLDTKIARFSRNSFYAKYYTAKSRIERVFMRSNLYRYAKYLTSQKSPRDFSDTLKYTISAEQADAMLKEIKELSKKYSFKLVLVFLPLNTRLATDQMQGLRQLADRNGIRYFDLDRGILDSEFKINLFFPRDPCHLNEYGNAVVAEMLKFCFANIL